jgi:uncharacterized protein VirK/YbjX
MADTVISKYISNLKTGLQFARNGFTGESDSYKRKQIIKTLYFFSTNFKLTNLWLSKLNGEELGDVFKYRPRIFLKPYRPYLSTQWSKLKAINVILNNYNFLRKKGLINLIGTNSSHISFFSLKDGIDARLEIGYDEKFRKEGEMVVKFVSDDLGGVISMASFSFENESGVWTCRIGCIQGNNELPSDKIKLAQKLMYGLRPKVLVVFAIQMICNALQVDYLFGSGDSIQAHKKKHAIHIPWVHKIGFKYDEFWQEEGGLKREDGWFEIPIIPKRKSISEMKVHKRAYYLKRYELEKKIAEGIESSLNQLKSDF